MSAPIRGQRRRGVPSLVLPDDPDGRGWIASEPGVFVSHVRVGISAPLTARDCAHLERLPISVRYVGRPTVWGNPWRVTGGKDGRYHLSHFDRIATGWYCDHRSAAGAAVAGYGLHLEGMGDKLDAVAVARHVAPLVTADVLSCWCPLGAPCHADTLCDLVGRLRSGDLVPGLVATPDVCGGVLRIDVPGYSPVASSVTRDFTAMRETLGNDGGVECVARIYGIDPDLVRLAARVGGAL